MLGKCEMQSVSYFVSYIIPCMHVRTFIHINQMGKAALGTYFYKDTQCSRSYKLKCCSSSLIIFYFHVRNSFVFKKTQQISNIRRYRQSYQQEMYGQHILSGVLYSLDCLFLNYKKMKWDCQMCSSASHSKAKKQMLAQ